MLCWDLFLYLFFFAGLYSALLGFLPDGIDSGKEETLGESVFYIVKPFKLHRSRIKGYQWSFLAFKRFIQGFCFDWLQKNTIATAIEEPMGVMIGVIIKFDIEPAKHLSSSQPTVIPFDAVVFHISIPVAVIAKTVRSLLWQLANKSLGLRCTTQKAGLCCKHQFRGFCHWHRWVGLWLWLRLSAVVLWSSKCRVCTCAARIF